MWKSDSAPCAGRVAAARQPVDARCMTHEFVLRDVAQIA